MSISVESAEPVPPQTEEWHTENLRGKRVLITGGTGFIGRALVLRLVEMGCVVTVFTRSANRAQRKPLPVTWIEDLAVLDASAQFDFLLNFAGESLAQGRWNSAKKQRLVASRVGTTLALLDWVERALIKPSYLINASAIGVYGSRADIALTEANDLEVGVTGGFGQKLCREWEAAADRFTMAGVPVCKLRLGVVFAAEGGAFAQLRRSFDFKVATVMGDGQHYCSWIHRDDVLRGIEFLLTKSPQTYPIGVFNVTAPQPLTYAELADQLATARETWLTLPLPAALLRLLLGEMAQELLLSGQKVIPARLQALGFTFRYPTFSAALLDLLAK